MVKKLKVTEVKKASSMCRVTKELMKDGKERERKATEPMPMEAAGRSCINRVEVGRL